MYLQPLVSVGIPTYNRPVGLRKTLLSITNQSYKNLEIIISDNCSEDETVMEIAQEFVRSDSRVTYYRQDRNTGAYNFQFILEKATGDFFMWAADDDDRTLTVIEELVSVIKDHSAAFSNYAVKYEESGHVDHVRILASAKGNDKYEQARNFLQARIPSMIYGLYRTNTIKWFVDAGELFDWFDCCLIFRTILLNNGFAFCEKELFTFGIKGSSYEYKPRKPMKSRVFTYGPYVRHSCTVIIESDVNFIGKIKLLLYLFEVNLRSFIATEKIRKSYRYYAYFYKIFNWLRPTVLPREH